MNKRVIKLAHIVALMAFGLAGVIVVAQQSSTGSQQNTNTSGQQNRNTGRQNNANSNAGSNTNDNTTDNTYRGMGDNTSGDNRSNSNRNSNMSAGGGQSGMTGGQLGSTDRKFVMEAAMGGMMEVELGRLAVERASSEGVRQFGQRMIDDHTRANQQLMQIASGLGVTPPAALDAKHTAMVAKMARLSGAEFDRAYIKQMVKDHQKMVALFQREAARGMQPDLRGFASQTLPALQEHLQMARSMAGGNHNNNNNHNTSGSGAGSTRP